MAVKLIGKVSPTIGGAYSATTIYYPLSFVQDNGSTYLSKQQVSGVEPGVTSGWATYWMLIASKGDTGDTGRGLTILGTYATLSALQAAVTSPSVGDAYGVGTEAPYTVYIWGGSAWVNYGDLTSSDAVLYDAQTLTTAQQQQATTNIGAVSSNAQTLTTDQQLQATANIGAVSVNAQTLTTTQQQQAATNAGVVSVNAQTLTSTQQAQAVSNIGGVSTAAQSLTTGKQLQAANNIGVVSLNEQTLTDAQTLQARYNLNITPHIYDNTYAVDLSEYFITWSSIESAITSGDFSHIRIGDYWPLTFSGSFYDAAAGSFTTISLLDFNVYVAGINHNSGYNSASARNTPSVDFISMSSVSNASMNSTDSNSGGYIGSNLYTTLNGTSGLVTLLPSALQNVIAEKYAYTETKTSTKATGWSSNSLGKLWIPSEYEVFGSNIFSDPYACSIPIQYPIYHGSTVNIPNTSGASGYNWLMSSAANSSTSFCATFHKVPGVRSASLTGYFQLCFKVS